MSEAVRDLIKSTGDMKRSIAKLIPIFRLGIANEDPAIRQLAADLILLRAGIVSANEWAEFAGQLKPEDEYIRAIAWLGRLFGPMQRADEALDSAMQRQRLETVLWLIEHHPESGVHKRVITTFNGRGEEEAYDLVKSTWLKRIAESPENGNIVANAAYFCKKRDPVVSQKLVSAFKKWQPRINKWQRRLSKLKQPEATPQGPKEKPRKQRLKRGAKRRGRKTG